jgi:hypothetical protein
VPRWNGAGGAVVNLELHGGDSRCVARATERTGTESVFDRYVIVNEADLRSRLQRLAGTFSGKWRGQWPGADFVFAVSD